MVLVSVSQRDWGDRSVSFNSQDPTASWLVGQIASSEHLIECSGSKTPRLSRRSRPMAWRAELPPEFLANVSPQIAAERAIPFLLGRSSQGNAGLSRSLPATFLDCRFSLGLLFGLLSGPLCSALPLDRRTAPMSPRHARFGSSRDTQWLRPALLIITSAAVS